MRCGPEPTEISWGQAKHNAAHLPDLTVPTRISINDDVSGIKPLDATMQGAKELTHFALGPAALRVVTGITGVTSRFD